MKLVLLLVSSFSLAAQPLKVPQEFYEGSEKSVPTCDPYPLMTDMAFSALSDHVIDQNTEWFDPALVKQGDIIYLNIWYMEWFEKSVHDAIQHPYILITRDVGDWLPHPDYKRLLYDPKLAAWFCRNLVFSYHPKLIQLPMGPYDRTLHDYSFPYLKRLVSKKHHEKPYFLYMNFLPRAFGDRDQILKLFEHEPYCFSRNHTGEDYVRVSRLSKEDYYDELAASQFVISPLGLETDCVRTWEAFVLQCIPIVEHTFLDPLYEGLPIVFVHEWTEVNEPFLKRQATLLKNCTREKAFIDPWRALILETQKKVKSNDLSLSYLEATQLGSQDLQDLTALLEGNTAVVYRGFLSGIHALQLASAANFLSKIHLCDPWLDQKSLRSFGVHLKDQTLMKDHKKISLISYKVFDSLFSSLSRNGYPIFIDFSYYRNSLVRDPTLKDFRHSLRKDLNDLYQVATQDTLICGNMVKNEYVKEVLEKFSQDVHRTIETKGNFWYLRK